MDLWDLHMLFEEKLIVQIKYLYYTCLETCFQEWKINMYQTHCHINSMLVCWWDGENNTHYHKLIRQMYSNPTNTTGQFLWGNEVSWHGIKTIKKYRIGSFVTFVYTLP